MSEHDVDVVTALLLEDSSLERLRRGIVAHPLLGLIEHHDFPAILAALLPDGHRLVKAIGAFKRIGESVPLHAHEETTTLWYPFGSITPLVVCTPCGMDSEEFFPAPGQAIRLSPGVLHRVPKVQEPDGRIVVAILSVPE